MRPTRAPLVLVAATTSAAAFAVLAPLTTGGTAGPTDAPAAVVRMDPARRLAARAARSVQGARERRLTAARSDGQDYYVVHVEFRDARACADYRHDGVTPLTRFERFATCFVRGGDEKALDA